MHRITSILFILLFFSMISLADDGNIQIIKVKGVYAIIDRGETQGIQQGQIFIVKRLITGKLKEICKVTVLRTTAHRAAVHQVKQNENLRLQRFDKLYLFPQKSLVVKNETKPSIPSDADDGNAFITKKITKKSDAVSHDSKITVKKSTALQTVLKSPWISLNMGTTIPGDNVGTSYSPSLTFGGSYAVRINRSLNIGLEINQTVLKGSSFESGVPNQFLSESASILEALVIIQKFFGSTFFLEAGGGIFRPKIHTTNIDATESIFSSTNFGFLGGGGIFIPTGTYTGLILKARLSSYFDRGRNKNYFGFTGGFRFRLRR